MLGMAVVVLAAHFASYRWQVGYEIVGQAIPIVLLEAGELKITYYSVVERDVATVRGWFTSSGLCTMRKRFSLDNW